MIDHKQILDKIVSDYTQILGDNLTGIYLHGSLAMGCATDSSDIDFLVVVENPLTIIECRRLIDTILGLKNLPQKGAEISVVLKKHCVDFVYPTPFELHYSDYYKEKYQNDPDFICGGLEDKDLAAHFVTTKHRGICLYGEAIDNVFADIPKEIYLDAISYDNADAKDSITTDSVYHILNLCRTLAYINENKVLSKLEGGQWALGKVDAAFIGIIKQAIRLYSDIDSNLDFDEDLLNEFVQYMYKQTGYKAS